MDATCLHQAILTATHRTESVHLQETIIEIITQKGLIHGTKDPGQAKTHIGDNLKLIQNAVLHTLVQAVRVIGAQITQAGKFRIESQQLHDHLLEHQQDQQVHHRREEALPPVEVHLVLAIQEVLEHSVAVLAEVAAEEVVADADNIGQTLYS